MLSGSRVLILTCMAFVLLLMFGGFSYADWNNCCWSDDFQDGDYTNNESWTTFEGPVPGTSGTHAVEDVGGGDYQFHFTSTYYGDPVYAGWSGAFVDYETVDQGIEGWVNTSPTQQNGWGSLALLRYSTGSGFGKGYGLAIAHNANDRVTATLYYLNELESGPLTSEETVLDSYDDVWFRFMATGTDADTRLRAKVWADETGVSEPGEWLFDITPSTPIFNSGSGGLGVVTQYSEATGDAYFDNIKYGTPEPGTMLLMAAGIGALALRRRRSS